MSLINSNNGWDPLEEVWLGDSYPASFYDHLAPAVRDAFYTITEWTKEDFSAIEKKLTELGVTVRRPEYGSIDDCLDENDNLLKPVVAARDETLVLENTMYHLRNKFKVNPWQKWIDLYRESGSTVLEYVDPDPWACISPPCMVRIGRDLYIDHTFHEDVWGVATEPLVDLAKKYRVHVSMINGHSDCVFCPVEEGLILTTMYKKHYNATFPGWEIYNINHADREVNPNMAYAGHTGGFHQWHIPDSKIGANKEFAQHVQDHAQNWVGEFQETVFDVNLLVVDEKNILSVGATQGDAEETFEFLHKRGYNVHVFDFRCRNFWDGGMHCMTNDIRRKSTLNDYFPNRQGPCLDWLLDDEE